MLSYLNSSLYRTNSHNNDTCSNTSTNYKYSIDSNDSSVTSFTLESSDHEIKLHKNPPVFEPKSKSDKNIKVRFSSESIDNLSTAFSIFFNNEDIKEFNNVVICIIDIVGFSKWCSNQVPNQIVKVMKNYNAHIINLIKKYKSLMKVELVGDYCMVVGGLDETINRQLCILDTIQFATELLRNIVDIQKIFMNKSIGVRIGIHISNVIGVLFNNPLRFQLYSNDVNICKRLENSAIKNTLHISLKTILSIQSHNNFDCPYEDCIRDTLSENEYKGVGFQPSFIFHVKKKDIMIFSETKSILNKYLQVVSFNSSRNYIPIVGDMQHIFDEMYSFFWEHIIFIILNRETLKSFTDQLFQFRIWEKNRNSQNILVICDTSLVENDDILKDLCIFLPISEKKDEVMVKIEQLITLNSNLKQQRSSLDLQT